MILGQENSWDYKHINIIHFSILAEMYRTDIFNDLHIKKSLFSVFLLLIFPSDQNKYFTLLSLKKASQIKDNIIPI